MDHEKGLLTEGSSKKDYHIVLLVMLVFFVISLITNILNSIIVDVKESFDLSLTMTGFLPFTFFIAYGVMSIPAGFLSERFENKALLSFSFLLMTLASLVFVFVPTHIVFSFTLFVLGSCMAILQVIINPMLRVAGGEEHFAFNSVVAQLVFGVASFSSPYLYKYLVNDDANKNLATILRSFVPEHIPWASLYLVFSVFCFVLVLIVLLTKYPTYEKEEGEKAGDSISYMTLIKNKYTHLYFLGIFCYVGIEQGVGNWISQFLQEYHQIDPQTFGANTVAYFWAMLTVGCILGLVLLKIFDSRKVLVGTTGITIVCLFFALLGNSSISLFAFPMLGFFISVMWPIIFSLGLNSIKNHHGSLSGILCTGIAGGAILPFLIGVIGEITSIKTALFFIMIPLLFILSIGFWAKPLITNKILKSKTESK
tara:strand:- start:1099 stop:2373 length:1275 start_codon:yes stop_codon:yes gene_type:complete